MEAGLRKATGDSTGAGTGVRDTENLGNRQELGTGIGAPPWGRLPTVPGYQEGPHHSAVPLPRRTRAERVQAPASKAADVTTMVKGQVFNYPRNDPRE